MSKRPLRSSQILAPFGIGQIVNFPDDESLMIAGIDLWDQAFLNRQSGAGDQVSMNRNEFRVIESRLSQKLGVSSFYSPYFWKENSKSNTEIPIPAVRFPQWHHCVKNTCGTMKKIELHTEDPESLKCTHCDGNTRMIPVRFVAVCGKGHIEDVPFMEWVHRGIISDSQHILKYKTLPGTGDLSGIQISCSCGLFRSLGGITREGALDNLGSKYDEEENMDANTHHSNNYKCKGRKPWLGLKGIDNPDVCENSLQVVLRGAANVHYSHIASSIYLPEENNLKVLAEQIVQNQAGGLETFRTFYNYDINNLIPLVTFINSIEEVRQSRIGNDYLLDYILDLLNPKDGANNETNEITDEIFRHQEYQVIAGIDQNHKTLVTKNKEGFPNYDESKYLNCFFTKVILLEKMRETNAFTGFSRLLPQDGYTPTERMRLLSSDIVDWLPATVVYGEGIFLEFKQEKLKEWLEKYDDKGNDLLVRYHAYMRERTPDYQERYINPVFILLHTFAHLLIKRLCFNCGYGSSSLRERIYFSDNDETKMYGILIYTSSSDSEGSMGGLVNQGRELFLANLIKESVEDARWCSADPVCMDVGINSGQGPGSVNGAACHNCAIVSETSCEEFNMLLDRSTLIGTIKNPEVGYFN